VPPKKLPFPCNNWKPSCDFSPPRGSRDSVSGGYRNIEQQARMTHDSSTFHFFRPNDSLTPISKRDQPHAQLRLFGEPERHPTSFRHRIYYPYLKPSNLLSKTAFISLINPYFTTPCCQVRLSTNGPSRVLITLQSIA
jgi:hypothetical protein